MIVFFIPPVMEGKEKIDILLDSLHNHLEFDRQRVDLLNAIGYEYWIVDPNESEVYGAQALNLAELQNYPEGIAFAHRVIGVAHWARGNYTPALGHLIRALEGYQHLEDELGKANCQLNIGLVYGDQLNNDKALEYFERALDGFQVLGETGRMATTFTKIGTIYANQRNFKEADEYLQNALEIHKETGFAYGLAEVHNRIGILRLDSNKPEEALQHFRQSIEVGKTIEDQHGIASNKLYIGKVLAGKGLKEEAEKEFKEALHLAERLDIKKFVREINWELMQLAEGQGKAMEALKYFYAYDSARESLFNEELSNNLAEMESRLAVFEKENELRIQQNQIAMLEKQNSLNQVLRIALIALLLTIVLAGFFIFRAQKFKLRNNRLKREELERQLNFKNRELASYAINFVQKNELLVSVKNDISQLRIAPESSVNTSLRQLERQIDESFQIDRDWAEFEKRFEDLHSQFFSGLKENHPELSSNDLRLCALLRLNLNIKEMASILHISPDSVKTARYRLRKKLGLTHEDTLIDFLLRFERENMTA